MSRGRIEKALSGFYYVNTGAEVLQCRARGKFRREGLSPLVGDWVQVRELGGGEGFVEAVESRRNLFLRPAAANIDQLVIIASAAIPVTDPYLIDRIAAIAALKGCGVLVCLNKTDLDPADELFAIYSQSAIPALRVSAETGEGMDALREQIRGKLSVFTGNSGVGKSSILNCLCPGLSLQVGEVSQALGRGRHTTRHVEMFSVEENTWVIDTPGFSSFDTEELSLEQLREECFILLEPEDNAPVEPQLRQAGVRVGYRVKDDYTILAMVESGLGVSVLPHLLLQRTSYRVHAARLMPPVARRMGILLPKERGIAAVVPVCHKHLLFGIRKLQHPFKPKRGAHRVPVRAQMAADYNFSVLLYFFKQFALYGRIHIIFPLRCSFCPNR